MESLLWFNLECRDDQRFLSVDVLPAAQRAVPGAMEAGPFLGCAWFRLVFSVASDELPAHSHIHTHADQHQIVVSGAGDEHQLFVGRSAAAV